MSSNYDSTIRLKLVRLSVWCGFLAVVGRLFYWQILQGSELRAAAEAQYTGSSILQGSRGRIFTHEGHLLVGNQPGYQLFAHPNQISSENVNHIAAAVADVLNDPEASSSAQALSKQQILDKISDPQKKWVQLAPFVTESQYHSISEQALQGIGLTRVENRFYPESSVAAHLTGFVGKNDEGQPTGYFGVEGELNLELTSRQVTLQTERDAQGVPLFLSSWLAPQISNGRDVKLTVRRDIQHLLDESIKTGVEKYQAKSGEVVVMNPRTGHIYGMAIYPSYDPANYNQFDPQLYKNPLAADGYEPGSTFKVLTVAAGIDSGVISPDTVCPKCASAREISGYTIKTWNDKYNPNISIKDALAKSDNTAMIYVAESVGIDRFVEYIHKFQIGESSGIELQEDSGTLVKDNWRLIDLATASFGQGIATTGLQMVKAVSAIANDGQMVQPQLIESVIIDGKEKSVPTEIAGTPISAETAQTVTDMMVYAAQSGEAQWTTSKRYTVAGKTGTAQIPIRGQYDEEKTIASYIGFAPAQHPEFVMLVKLTEPQSSPWASETAAPLWYDIAHQLFLHLNIPPDRE